MNVRQGGEGCYRYRIHAADTIPALPKEILADRSKDTILTSRCEDKDENKKYRYSQDSVKGLIWVTSKDESLHGSHVLHSINPAINARFAWTRVGIEWTIGEITWENRTGVRRTFKHKYTANMM